MCILDWSVEWMHADRQKLLKSVAYLGLPYLLFSSFAIQHSLCYVTSIIMEHSN